MEKNGNQGNMRFYEKMRTVPNDAKKPISGGRTAGLTNISPMWRIKVMTEVFGPCGIGWKYEITKQWKESYGEEVKTYCNVNLFIKVDGVWSDPIPGTGGSSFATKERNGVYVDDEDQKKALTDALSVAMKALGVGADVYYADSADNKYRSNDQIEQPAVQAKTTANEFTPQIQGEILSCADMNGLNAVWYKYSDLQGNNSFREAWAKQRGLVERK